MSGIVQFIITHAQNAHWFIFVGVLLAGFNIPISIDFLLIAAALIAATIIPEHTPHLFLSIYLGAMISAWIAYSIGRLLGPQLFHIPLFRKVVTPNRLEKMERFHTRFGLLSLIIGRFIPFGIRNCIFMSSGLSKVPFPLFMARDALACLLWSSTCFTAAFFLGQNYPLLVQAFKTFNLLIFGVFSVTVIVLLWYKRKRHLQNSRP